MDYREVLNDLIEINNDRIAGYEKAAALTHEEDLLRTFNSMGDQSRGFVKALDETVKSAGGQAATGTTLRGKVYRTWMDIKSSFGGDDRKSILESCEYGEDAAKEAYKEALQEEFPSEIETLVKQQYDLLVQSHDKIHMLRDLEPTGEKQPKDIRRSAL